MSVPTTYYVFSSDTRDIWRQWGLLMGNKSIMFVCLFICLCNHSYLLISVFWCNRHRYRCQTTNSPIRAWNIYENSPFSRKKFLSHCSIVKTTEWNGLIKIDN